MPDPLLEIDSLSISFSTETGRVGVVEDVSFAVTRRETVGLVGESGCGKSVTAMSIMRLIPSPPGHVDRGRILFQGADLLTHSGAQMRAVRGNRIGMVFQEPMTSLNPTLTIGYQIAEVFRVHQRMNAAGARREAIDILSMVGIGAPQHRLRQYPHELSGGLRQRAMIAMALACRPDLLIADEPTTALDVTVQAQILHLMRELQREFGAAVILITHDMGVVAETCDTVVVMYAGKVVEACGIFQLFEETRHPYSRGLLDSIPKIGITKSEELPTIEGVVPSLLHPPEGCRFADRCSRVEDLCRGQDPPLEEVSAGHQVACHFPLEVSS